jgi:phosphate transport system substrate-binding protein
MKLNKIIKCSVRVIVLAAVAALLFWMSGCAKRTAKNEMIIIKGSDTMVHLVTAWVEAFMDKKPDIKVAVTGGGSGTGIAALINGTTDICASSREIKTKEKQMAEERNIITVEHIVARDGIAVVVNPKNPVNELDMKQLEQIFTGAYSNWNQAGGVDEKILIFSRESSSGTFAFFQEHVLKNKDYSPNAKLMTSTSVIIESVSADKGAIGYVGLGYAQGAKDRVKILKIKADAGSQAVIPSEETVISGRYPIARPLYLYVNEQLSEEVSEFVNFCLSSDGQDIVRKSGYVAIK